MPKTFLPALHGNATVTGQDDTLDEFARLWLPMLGEKADDMVLDDRLVKCATDHAAYLASRTGDELEQNMHVGRGHSTPNERVRAVGVTLPSYWPQKGNQVESCARTHKGTARALQLWIESPAHHDHVLHEGWFSEHIMWGFANADDDYVFLACPKGG